MRLFIAKIYIVFYIFKKPLTHKDKNYIMIIRTKVLELFEPLVM